MKFITPIYKNWKTTLAFIVLLVIIQQLFVRNYEFQQPIISKRAESFIDVSNERAQCLTDLQAMQTARDDANADILNNNIK